jgi:LCP family protein required for cell wall assembly
MVESEAAPREPGGPLRPSRIGTAFLILAGLLSFLLTAGSAVAIYGIKYFDRQLKTVHINRTDDTSSPQQCNKRPCNFLILGSDSRKGLSKKEQQKIGTGPGAVEGQRADTIIVVNVNTAEDRTTVLHIPRDLLVSIPKHGQNKINSAFQYGPNAMVQTVEKLTGLDINHYVQINFAGFEGLVDALGGVDICVNKTLVDPLAGLDLPHAGCYHLNGRRALAFVRARHVEGDTIPDFSRIARQQQFMRAVIDKLLSASALLKNPVGLFNAVKDNLVVDDGLNVYDLQDLTRKLSGLGQGGVLFRVVPAVPQVINGVDYVVATPGATRLFRRIREGRSPGELGREQALTNLSPATVSVQVYDAGSGGSAAKVADYLERAGFQVRGVAPAPAGLHGSEILYRIATRDQRDVVASYLLDWSTKRSTAAVEASGADVVIVVDSNSPGVPR